MTGYIAEKASEWKKYLSIVFVFRISNALYRNVRFVVQYRSVLYVINIG